MTRIFNKGSLPRVATLAVILISAVFLSAQVSPDLASLNRPSNVPTGYVVTPFGYFHPFCVVKVDEGETILADGRLQHANGAVDAKAPVCNYPHYTASGRMLGPDMRNARGFIVPAINGWLEYVSATTNTSYAQISATWPVPAPPTIFQGQSLFFFPGFQDINNSLSIVQPVLQYGQSAAGGGKFWGIASWNCCQSGVVWHSGLKKVNSGDTIFGSIKSACTKKNPNCGNWKILTQDQTTGKKSTLAKTPADGQVWNWAFGAVLEVYSVNQCSDFPADSSVLFTTQLYDQNNKLISDPGWVESPAGSGISPQCSYGLISTPTEETLQW